MNVPLRDGDIAVRCNTVTIEDGIMVDFTAGHIKTEESRKLIEELEARCSSETIPLLSGRQLPASHGRPQARRTDAQCTADAQTSPAAKPPIIFPRATMPHS